MWEKELELLQNGWPGLASWGKAGHVSWDLAVENETTTRSARGKAFQSGRQHRRPALARSRIPRQACKGVIVGNKEDVIENGVGEVCWCHRPLRQPAGEGFHSKCNRKPRETLKHHAWDIILTFLKDHSDWWVKEGLQKWKGQLGAFDLD